MLSRRRLLSLASALPILAVLAPISATHARVVRGVAAQARPAPAGRSDTRCAACGSSGHTMLDAGCPSARHLLRTQRR